MLVLGLYLFRQAGCPENRELTRPSNECLVLGLWLGYFHAGCGAT